MLIYFEKYIVFTCCFASYQFLQFGILFSLVACCFLSIPAIQYIVFTCCLLLFINWSHIIIFLFWKLMGFWVPGFLVISFFVSWQGDLKILHCRKCRKLQVSSMFPGKEISRFCTAGNVGNCKFPSMFPCNVTLPIPMYPATRKLHISLTFC